MTDDIFKAHRSKAKGSSGEREVRKLLDAHGVNHVWYCYADQRWTGGLPDIETDNFAIEVKRYATGGFLAAWWEQAERAAEKSGKRPAVAYRYDHRKWRVRVHAVPQFGSDMMIADLPFEEWLQVERL